MKIIKLMEEKTPMTKEPLNEEIISLKEEEEIGVVEKDGGATTEVDVAMTSTGDDARPARKKDALKIVNALTKKLDQALDDARYALEEENYDANCNILVTGLPGSSKTATIRNWCRQNGCNLYYLDSKNPDLQLLTSGASAIDRTDPEHPKVNTAFSNALSKLDRPNSVLFLDELNRQIKEYMRGSLLTLIADRRVAGEDEEGFRYFPNLLFTVAAINPPKEGDRGATNLNDAERRRFYYSVHFDSEKQTTEVYFNEYYDNKILEYVAAHSELTAADITRINSFCLRQWIGKKIITNEDFHYTTMDEYLADSVKGQITCQSTITELIDHSRGDTKRLINDINESDLSAEAKDMLIRIINGLVLPNIDALRAKKAADLGLDLKVVDDAGAESVDEPEDDDDEVKPEDFELGREDDADYYDDGSGAAAGTVDADKAKESKMSDAAIEDKLSKFTASF